MSLISFLKQAPGSSTWVVLLYIQEKHMKDSCVGKITFVLASFIAL